MPRDIDEIRLDILRTRTRMRHTSEAIGRKADMPMRTASLVGDAAGLAGDWLREHLPARHEHNGHAGNGHGGEAGPGLVDRATGVAAKSAGEAVGDTVGSAAHAVGDAASATGRAVRRQAGDVMDNPMLLGLLALAGGVAIGLAAPTSRAEEDAAAPLAESAKEAAGRAGERLATAAAG